MAGGGGRPGDGLDRAEVGGAMRVAQPRQHALDRLEAAVEHEAEHAAEAAHLPPGHVVMRMCRQPGVVNGRHRGLGLQPGAILSALSFCWRTRRCSVFMPADQQVGRHRIERRAGDLAVVIDLPDQPRIAADDAAQRIGVAAQKLGGAVQHQVHAQLERVLVDGRGKRVVGHHDRAGACAGRGQARDVQHLERGVGGRFQVEHPAALGDRRLDLRVVGRIAQRHLHLEAGQELGEDLVGAAVGVLDRHDPVAGREQREERVADGGHAGGEAGGRLRAFQQPHLFLERVHGGVGVAAVDVARLAAQRHVQPLSTSG